MGNTLCCCCHLTSQHHYGSSGWCSAAPPAGEEDYEAPVTHADVSLMGRETQQLLQRVEELLLLHCRLHRCTGGLPSDGASLQMQLERELQHLQECITRSLCDVTCHEVLGGRDDDPPENTVPRHPLLPAVHPQKAEAAVQTTTAGSCPACRTSDADRWCSVAVQTSFPCPQASPAAATDAALPPPVISSCADAALPPPVIPSCADVALPPPAISATKAEGALDEAGDPTRQLSFPYFPKPAYDQLEVYRMARKLSVLPEEREDSPLATPRAHKTSSPTLMDTVTIQVSSMSTTVLQNSRLAEWREDVAIAGQAAVIPFAPSLASRQTTELSPSKGRSSNSLGNESPHSVLSSDCPADITPVFGCRQVPLVNCSELFSLDTDTKSASSFPKSNSGNSSGSCVTPLLSPESITSQALALQSPVSPFSCSPSPRLPDPSNDEDAVAFSWGTVSSPLLESGLSSLHCSCSDPFTTAANSAPSSLPDAPNPSAATLCMTDHPIIAARRLSFFKDSLPTAHPPKNYDINLASISTNPCSTILNSKSATAISFDETINAAVTKRRRFLRDAIEPPRDSCCDLTSLPVQRDIDTAFVAAAAADSGCSDVSMTSSVAPQSCILDPESEPLITLDRDVDEGHNCSSKAVFSNLPGLPLSQCRPLQVSSKLYCKLVNQSSSCEESEPPQGQFPSFPVPVPLAAGDSGTADSAPEEPRRDSLSLPTAAWAFFRRRRSSGTSDVSSAGSPVYYTPPDTSPWGSPRTSLDLHEVAATGGSSSRSTPLHTPRPTFSAQRSPLSQEVTGFSHSDSDVRRYSVHAFFSPRSPTSAARGGCGVKHALTRLALLEGTHQGGASSAPSTPSSSAVDTLPPDAGELQKRSLDSSLKL